MGIVKSFLNDTFERLHTLERHSVPRALVQLRLGVHFFFGARPGRAREQTILTHYVENVTGLFSKRSSGFFCAAAPKRNGSVTFVP
jgi:hypothetical protein